VAAGLFAAGCSSSGGGQPAKKNPGEQGGTPVAGGSVTYAEVTGNEPQYIFPFVDPGHFATWNMNDFQYLMYRPLYWLGVGENPQQVDYTRSVGNQPVWSADGKTVSVTLKPWKWSNGEPVDAQDVEFYVNMYKAEETQNGGYIPPLHGLNFFPDNVTSMQASGQTITFHLDQAYSKVWYLFNELSQITPMPEAWDITGPGQPSDCSTATGKKMLTDCAAVWKYLYNGPNKDLKGYASSTIWSVVDGPWKLSAFTPDGHCTFVPNPSYSGPYKAKLNEFKEEPFASDTSEYNQLTAGPNAGENALQVGYLPQEYLKQRTSNPAVGQSYPLSDKYAMEPWIAYTINYFTLNMNNPSVGPIFKQLYFRQAFQETVDQQAIINNVWKGYGYLTTGPQPLLPNTSLVSNGEKNFAYGFDLSKAKQTLANNGWDVSKTPAVCTRAGTAPGDCGAGISQGEKLEFNLQYANGSSPLQQIMTQLQSDAGQAGIKLNMQQQAAELITGNDTACTPSPKTPCTWQMGNWGAGWVFAPDYLPTDEDLFATGSVANYGSYSDPRADALIKASILSSSTQTYDAAEDYIASQVPVIWQADYANPLTMYAKNLRGYDPQNVFLNITPEEWYFVK
jgi:peptide/nickel transport system substrate-binding protein